MNRPADESFQDSAASWRRLGICLLIAVVGNVGMWAIVIIMPDVQAEFGAGRAAAAMPYMATMVGFAVGNFLAGRMVDRIGIAPVLAATSVVLSGGFMASALAPSLSVLTAIHLLIGLATATSFGPLMADISHWFQKRRGIAVAITASGNYLSGAIWPLILTGALPAGDWRGVFLALAAITLVTVLPLSFALRRRPSESALAAADAAASGRRRSAGLSPRVLALLLGAAGVGCCVAMSMPQVHVVSYAVDLGFGADAGARMLSLMLLGGVVSRLLSGVLADHLGGLPTLLIGAAAQMTALVLFLPAETLPLLLTVSLIFGLSQGGIVPGYAIVVREYMPAAEAGRRVGFVMMMTIMGMALGGWLSGAIHDATGSYRLAFFNGIAWNAANLAILVTLLMRSRPRQPRPQGA